MCHDILENEDRRRDTAMAGIVQVGIIFMNVYGRKKAINYFKSTSIPRKTFKRIVFGEYRGDGSSGYADPVPTTIPT